MKNYKKMIPLSIRKNLLELKTLIAVIHEKNVSKWMIENALRNYERFPNYKHKVISMATIQFP